jgi:hypothetical protein
MFEKTNAKCKFTIALASISFFCFKLEDFFNIETVLFLSTVSGTGAADCTGAVVLH